MKKIHINPQSKGSLGKSFETECRVAFLDSVGLPWHGFDLDDRHATFYKRHPMNVELISLERDPKDAVIRMMSQAIARPEPIILIDCRAQADLLIRESFNTLGIFNYAKNASAEFVVSLFPSDDNESMSNLADITRWGAGKAQFVIVRNPAKSIAETFETSSMRKTLLSQLGAKEIQLPEVTATSLQTLERIQRNSKSIYTFAEFACGLDGIDPLITGEFAYLLSQMAKQYSTIASVLIPETELCKIVKSKSSKTTAPIDFLDLGL